MRLVLGLLPLAIISCASPNGVPTGTKTGENHGPSLDGFVQADEDLASPPTMDLASQADLFSMTDLSTTTVADMATTSSGCSGGVTYAGSCSGYVLTYCSTATNTVKTINCALGGYNCSVVSGDADCREPTSGCGPVTTAGLCDGNTLKYCNAGHIVKQACGLFFTCVNNGTFADCY